MRSPRTVARTLGLLFLLVILTGLFAQGFVSDRLVVFSDSAKTASNILANQGLFRLAFTVFLIEMISQIATAALWYVLLRPVSRPIALVAAFVELAGSIIKSFARVFFIAPLFVLSGTAALSSFSNEQLQSISVLLLRINNQGAAMALAFFGVSTLLNGFLVFRSTFLPRWLGVLSMISGLGWLTFLYPPLGAKLFLVVALFALASCAATIFWLIVFGVDEEKWKVRASNQ